MTNLSSLSSIVDLDAKVSPSILAEILGVNVQVLYSDARKGRLPSVLIEATYRECIQMYVAHYKKNVDLKLEQEKNERELREKKLQLDIEFKEKQIASKKKGFSGDTGEADPLHPLVAAKMKQDIRLGIAREAQLWLKVAIERQEYISVRELYALTEPFVQAIKTVLVSLSTEYPEAQESIDDSMESLYNLGMKLLEQANMDKDEFVNRMLEKDIDIDTIELEFTAGESI
ncbi:hypothetical protein FJZ55_09455, partial [Candidatus Woesearchaeota archaeon]|nr:hypothetical protein [Candidatus Woesearchaeota archaeon]